MLSFGDEINPVLVIYSLFKERVRGRKALRLNCFSRNLHHEPVEAGAPSPPLCCKVACFGRQKDGLKRGPPCSDTSEGEGEDRTLITIQGRRTCQGPMLQITCYYDTEVLEDNLRGC